MAGGAVGLAVSPAAERALEAQAAGVLPALLLVVAAVVLCAFRAGPPAVLAGLAVAAGLLAGLIGGERRLEAIEAGALPGPAGEERALTGFVLAVPKRSNGWVRFPVETGRGRIVAMAREPVRELRIGREVRVRGTVEPPPDWYEAQARRLGSRMVLQASSVEPTGGRRGGAAGLLDRVRDRALDSLARGMPAAEAELARGFVLGQDDGIAEPTVEAFRDSGLAHLLAVSGQNVVLLMLLATPVLALLGVGMPARLLWLAGVVAIYVPLAGGGPSIQRAGVMGVAGLAATAAGRPSSRLYALLLAAVITLALNPLAVGDVGWQLSFAAVLGIFLWTGGLRDVVLAALRRDAPVARALADGLAVTVAATLATAPLMALHFERLSLTSLAANLVAMPAVAPAMWLGMAAAVLGQVWSGLAVPLNLANSVLLAYVGEVAEAFSAPGWAAVDVPAPGLVTVVVVYAGLGLAVSGALLAFRKRAGGEPRRGLDPRIGGALALAAAAGAVLLLWLSPGGAPHLEPPGPGELRVDLLDVGQGDAILVREGGGGSVLIDSGPPGGGIAAALEGAEVEELDALLLTHGDSDHIGGVPDLAGEVEVGRLVRAAPSPEVRELAELTGAAPAAVARGDGLSLGRATLEILWPPPVTAPPEEPNTLSIVALLRWRGFSMLLTGDAEAEAAGYASPDVDVLKVAHHGSDDAGLPGLLGTARPELALISVGAGNTYGHPTDSTVEELEAAGAIVERTDLDGTISVLVEPGGYRVVASG